jgi:hypothetical protein
LNSKKGATIIKLNTAVINLSFQGILVAHWRRDKNTECMHLTGRMHPAPNFCIFSRTFWVSCAIQLVTSPISSFSDLSLSFTPHS